MKTLAFSAALVAVLLLPASADAQHVNLQIEDGRVSLEAQNVPVRQILAEWAKVGGAKIVNGEKVVGSPLTLQLQGVPERQALDIILRGVSGYMLAARQPGETGVSAFDRILILPTSSAPRNAAAPPSPAGVGMNRSAPMQPVQAEPAEEFVEDGDNDEPDPEEQNAEAAAEGEGEPSSMPAPPPNRFRRSNVMPNPMGAQAQPFMPPPAGVQVFPGQPAQPQQPGETPAVNHPFGVPAGASTTPGVVTPVPTPTTTTRPPR